MWCSVVPLIADKFIRDFRISSGHWLCFVDAILLVSYFLFGLQCISLADNTLEALTQHIIFIWLPVIVLGGDRH
jgi:hypothetical protein